MEKARITLRLTPKADDLLSVATTTNKRGAFVSQLIEQFVTEDGAVRDCSDGVLEQVNQKLDELKVTLEG